MIVTRSISIALATLLWIAAALADEVTLSPSKDNTLYSESGTVSNGAGDGIFVGRTGANNGGQIRRALIAFDIAGSIPAGSTITAVQLTMRVDQTQAGPTAVGLHRLLADWGEATSNASGNEGMGATAAIGDATWRFRFFNDSTRRWTKEGGDFATMVSGIETVGSIGSMPTWESTPAMIADVQGWLDAPATNFGWLIRDSEDAARTAKKFDSRQTINAANRPRLHVVFEPPAAATATATVQPTATATPPSSVTATSTFTAVASATHTATAPPTATATGVASATATSAPATATTSATGVAATNTAIPPTQTATATPPQTATGTAEVATATATDTTVATATETETVALPTATATEPVPLCVGDCDGNGTVIISELITGVNIALDRADIAVCRAFDANGDGRVTINELIAAVGNALSGC